METDDDVSSAAPEQAQAQQPDSSATLLLAGKWGPRMNVICVASSATAFLLVIVFLLLALHLSSTADALFFNRTNTTLP
jgi:hypothetical protein